jgi:hypothetical protein
VARAGCRRCYCGCENFLAVDGVESVATIAELTVHFDLAAFGDYAAYFVATEHAQHANHAVA